MNNSEQRLRLLEDKVLVMQREVGEVVAEMQVTVETLAKTLKIVTQTMHQRLIALEPQVPATTTETPESGKEL